MAEDQNQQERYNENDYYRIMQNLSAAVLNHLSFSGKAVMADMVRDALSYITFLHKKAYPELYNEDGTPKR